MDDRYEDLVCRADVRCGLYAAHTGWEWQPIDPVMYDTLWRLLNGELANQFAISGSKASFEAIPISGQAICGVVVPLHGRISIDSWNEKLRKFVDAKAA